MNISAVWKIAVCVASFSMCSLTCVAQPLGTKDAAIEQFGYSAKKESLRTFFDAISSRLNKPIIVSQRAASKQISGEFDLSNPQILLERVATQLSLTWYHDGQTIYIYDNGETKSVVLSLRYVSLDAFNNFLRKAGLYDRRFPLRGDHGTYYVSGPPIFVDLLINTAKFIDQDKKKPSEDDSYDGQKVVVIRLNNTFVGDRNYVMRDRTVTIPGMATVLGNLLKSDKRIAEAGMNKLGDESVSPPLSDAQEESSTAERVMALPFKKPAALLDIPRRRETAKAPTESIMILSYPNTNSLVVKGTQKQIRLVQDIVTALDVEKRHVELSLWIIDLQKDDLTQLGINWQGGVTVGNKFGVSFNTGSFSTLDGSRFLASVMALNGKKRAQVISRPILLTQENVPALFDNNRTFYAKLIGERSTQLEHVTYGTSVNVLPRFTGDDQIEMVLDIEDGAALVDTDGATSTTDSLPQIGRTHISTVARVPKEKSLLIGGYINDQNSNSLRKIPLLGDIPWVGGLFRYREENKNNLVRVFLIQPRQIEDPLLTDASTLANSMIDKRDLDSQQQRLRDYLDRIRQQKKTAQ